MKSVLVGSPFSDLEWLRLDSANVVVEPILANLPIYLSYLTYLTTYLPSMRAYIHTYVHLVSLYQLLVSTVYPIEPMEKNNPLPRSCLWLLWI